MAEAADSCKENSHREHDKVPLSIIIPTLNESLVIGQCLSQLQAWRSLGFEIIIADGGSSDDTLAQAAPFVDKIATLASGRSLQMNAGAAVANGRWLLFLHADTQLPQDFQQWMQFVGTRKQGWGFFPLRLSGGGLMFRMIESAINLRSSITRIATGDQCLFVEGELFSRIGQYPNIALMEDIALSKSLRRICPPTIWDSPVTTSSRRWEKRGVFKTILLMWSLRLAYWLGVAPEKLARVYHG